MLSKMDRKFVFLGFSRRENQSGKFVDKFHDPIIDSLVSKDCFMVEKPFKVDFKIPKKDIISLAELSPLTKELLDENSEAN